MIIKSPDPTSLPDLKSLWKEAFLDEDILIDTFFSVGFSPERCRCIQDDGFVAALYWFDCPWEDKKIAYIYGVATKKSRRGQGLCAALMEDTRRHLQNLGYHGAALVPADPALRAYYRKFGFQDFGGITQTDVFPTTPLPLGQLTKEEYAALRQQFLPQGGVGLAGDMLEYFSNLARFYAGDGFLFASEGNVVIPELLGHCPDIGGIAAALGVERLVVRTPGDTPFAMYLPLTDSKERPTYFGIALD